MPREECVETHLESNVSKNPDVASFRNMNASVALGPSSEMGVIGRCGRTVVISVHLLKCTVSSQASVFSLYVCGVAVRGIRAESP